MELNEIMRLIWQGLINLPGNAPEREETIRAYGALMSKLGYTHPEYLLVPRADGYTDVKFATEVGELKLGERMIEVPLERPVPQTYGDWVDLAEDIKERVGEGSPDYYEATHQLGIISELEEGSPEEAKRWLTRKAGDLGIK